MATNLETTLTLLMTWDFTNALDLSTPRDKNTLTCSDSLGQGTGSAQADLVWHDERTLTGTSESLDLAGSLTNAWGSTVTFAKVKGILIHNTNTTTLKVLAIGGAVATQFVNWVANSSDIVNIGPDGLFLLWSPVDGYAVGAGASDILKIDAGANTITYDIVIVGTSA